MKRACVLGLLALLACDSTETSTTGSTTADPTTSSAGGSTVTTTGPGSGGGGATTSNASGSGGAMPCAAADAQVVTLTTDDNVQLEGDLYTTGTKGTPGVVLLHMIPPSNTRKNYPPDFIAKVVAKGLNVINIDRRGAGNSGGVAKDAYLGPNGKLDAKAAVEHLLNHECAIDPKRVALVGASNGTTTALDFSVAASSLSHELPAALIFLTGGGYTEAQNKLADSLGLLGATPIQFVFSTMESGWSKQFESGAPALWQFDEYNPGGHGTKMFQTKPESMDDVASFLAKSLLQ